VVDGFCRAVLVHGPVIVVMVGRFFRVEDGMRHIMPMTEGETGGSDSRRVPQQ
jgi:hypothetical protein